MLVKFFTANHTQDWFTALLALFTHFSYHTFHCPISLFHQGQMKGMISMQTTLRFIINRVIHLLGWANGLLKSPFMNGATIMCGDDRGEELSPNGTMEAPQSPFPCTEYRLRTPTSLNLRVYKTFNQCKSCSSCLYPILKSWRGSFRQGNIWADLKQSAWKKKTVPRFLYPLRYFSLQVT